MSTTHERDLKQEVIRLTASNHSQTEIAMLLRIDISKVQRYQTHMHDPNKKKADIQKLETECLRVAGLIAEKGDSSSITERRYLGNLILAMSTETHEFINKPNK